MRKVSPYTFSVFVLCEREGVESEVNGSELAILELPVVKQTDMAAKRKEKNTKPKKYAHRVQKQ